MGKYHAGGGSMAISVMAAATWRMWQQRGAASSRRAYQSALIAMAA